MEIQKQLAVFMENRPGTLAEVCSILAEAKVNILALSVSDTVDHAVVRLVTSDAEKAIHLLGNAGALVVETDVLVVDLPNKPGALAEMAGKLAKARVNIEYTYCTAGPRQTKGYLVLRTSHPKKAMQALSS